MWQFFLLSLNLMANQGVFPMKKSGLNPECDCECPVRAGFWIRKCWEIALDLC